MTTEAIGKWQDTEQALFDVTRAYLREEGTVPKFFRKSEAELEQELLDRLHRQRMENMEKRLGGVY
jgi:hypothetical protein